MSQERLSSDVLERQFGATRLEVLQAGDMSRIICSKAEHDGQVLEISLVNFVPDGAELFPGAHRDALAGQSMGKAFREHGIKFRRVVKAAYSYELPTSFNQWFGETGPATVIDLSIRVGPDEIPYADILETFSPAVAWPHLTGGPTDEHFEKIGLLDRFLVTRSIQ